MNRGVGAIAGISCHAEPGAIGKLSHHGLGHWDFYVVELRLVFEDGHGEGVHGVG